MMVVLLTYDQKKIIEGKEYCDNMYFNPILDMDGNWIISIEERDQCVFFDFIKDLPLIDYKPVIYPSPL